MLHVFHVDAGRMMTFDMSLALESVESLKRFLQEQSKVAVDKQVLLISGGESLESDKRVCSYSAGTDTNPIFLFSKSSIESPKLPPIIAGHASESDIEAKVRDHCDMPTTFGTVSKRSQLAQELHENAKKQLETCEGLVHEQHLQHQGWSAVVANLEDITTDFRKRSEIFERSFNDYMDERESYLRFLEQFHADLELLRKIPVLPALQESEEGGATDDAEEGGATDAEEGGATDAEEGGATDAKEGGATDAEEGGATDAEEGGATDAKEGGATDAKEGGATDADEGGVAEDDAAAATAPKEVSLFDWMSAADSQSTMDQLFEHCSRGLEQFDRAAIGGLMGEVRKMIEAANDSKMKSVKGLGERLSGLETLMREVKDHVQRQADLANAFAMNLTRANNTKDATVLPNLCMSHKKQLQMMSSNHKLICDIERRCIKAKEELCININHRLRWVMFIEGQILQLDQKLVIYHENLKRLRRHLDVLQQIHVAPATYLCAVAEVVRRRAFSQTFLLWASELACHLLTIHDEEAARRREFHSTFDGHFVTDLFRGMDDAAPEFATRAPPAFDARLPRLGDDDVERLRAALPELARHLVVPDSTHVVDFFTVRSLVRKGEEEEERGKAEKVVGEASALEEETSAAAAGASDPKESDKCCESETDTEDFEKVGQSLPEPDAEETTPGVAAAMQDASTTTEVGETTAAPPPKPSPIPPPPSHVASPQSPPPFLGHPPGDFSGEEFFIDESLPSSLSVEAGAGTDISRQLDNAHNVVALLQDTLQTARSEQDRLRAALTAMHRAATEAIGQLRAEAAALREVVGGRERAEAAVEEGGRQRESGGEEVGRLGGLERDLGRAIIALGESMRAMAEAEEGHQRAVREVRERMTREHRDEIEGMRSRFRLMSQQINYAEAEEVVRETEERMGKRLEEAKERERRLTLECATHCQKIRSLEAAESRSRELALKAAALQRRNVQLEARVKEMEEAMEAAAEMVAGGGDPSIAMARSVAAVAMTPNVSVDSCKPGDAVVVAWDAEHTNFRVLQDNRHLYFLHSDYVEGMGLEVRDGRPNRMCAVGEVIDKEYCSAKKSENRYKVPKLTKFFRVKVKPPHVDHTHRGLAHSVHLPKAPRNDEEAPQRMTRSQSARPENLEGHETISEEVGHDTISEEVGHDTIPEEVWYGTIPEEVVHDTIPEEVKHDTIPEEVGHDTIPGKVGHDTVPEEVKHEAIAEGVGHETIPAVVGHFAEDSGIVENFEQASSFLEETLVPDESESSSDRQIFNNELMNQWK